MENLVSFRENLSVLLGEENFEQFQDFLRVRSVGRDLVLALATLGLVFSVKYKSASYTYTVHLTLLILQLFRNSRSTR